LEGGALLKDDFVKFAEKYVLFCHITSQVPGDKNQDLLELKGGEGFPYLVFMDSDGNVLAKHQGDRSAEGFDATGEKVRAFLALKAKAAKGDAAVKIEFIIAQLELGHIKPGEAESKLKETGGKLSPDQQKKFDAIRANSEIEELLRGVRNEETKNEAARKCYERLKAGKPAPTNDPWQVAYWNLVLEYAETKKDVAVFEQCFSFLKEKYGNLPQAKNYFQEKEAKLKELKGEK
jgi:hypothetical protein